MSRERIELAQDDARELVGIPQPAPLGYFKNIEQVEDIFGIEYSCGDGLFLSDLSGELFEKYDGYVDWKVIRNVDTRRIYKYPALLCFVYNPEYRRKGGELFEKARVKGKLVPKQ